MPKYISGRSKKTPQSALPADRYRYLSVSDSEPNLGDSPTDQGSPSLPSGQQYIVVGFRDRPGERFWIPNQGGIIPGSLSIFEENTLVGGLSSTTQLNFVGNAIAATGTSGPPPGVAVTITVAPPGFDNSVLFKDSGDFATDTRFTFDNGLFAAGDRITVGTGGTVITTTTGIGSVGIGTTEPTQRLHLHDGNFRITGTIYDSINQPGTQGDLIVKGASGGLLWVSPNAVQSGAGGTIGQVQFHNTGGLVDGADNFYFDFNNNRVGIGSTQPTQLLDVLGISTFSGGVFVDNLYADGLEVSGISKIPKITGITTFIQTNDNILGDPNTGAVQFDGGVGINKNLTVGLGITAQDLNISGIATIQILNLTSLEIVDLTVTGISTLGNVVVDTNTIKTKPGSGNLILDSDGIVQVNDPLYISGATESTSKDSGSIITEGGIGVEKSVNIGLKLNVGGAVSFTGPSVGVAVTLAGAGGITTTGGDLYVNGNVLPPHNATSNNDSSGKDIGASNANWRRVYAQEFVGAFIGIADKATNLAGGAAGSIPYQSAPDTTVFLAEPNADNKVLSYNNTSNSPTWIDLDKIQEGNTKAEVVDAGSNGYFTVETEGSEKFRVLSNGNVNFYDGGTQYYGSISKTSSGSFELLGYTNLDLVADGTRVSIDQIGVGIGSTQPTVELDINGKVALGSSVYDSNGSTGSNQQILSSAPGIGVSWTSIQDIAITVDKIEEGNTKAEVVDTGSDGHFKVETEGTERFRIGPAGIATFFGNGTATITSPSDLNLNANTVAISTDITIGGKIGLGDPVDYGSAGEVLTSNGSSSAPTWQGLSGVVQDKIQEGNTKAEVVDTGSDGHFKVETEGTEKFRITADGRVGIGTTNPYLETALHIHHPNSTLAIENSGTSGNGVTLLTIGQPGYEDLIIKHRAGNDSSYADVETMRFTDTGIRISNTNYSASAEANELIIGNTDNSNNRGLTIASGNLKSSSIYFGDNNNNAIGTIIYSHLLDALQIATNGSERLRIGSAGQIGLGGANYGSATQVLTSNGSNAAPTWEDPSGGSGISSDRIKEGNTLAEVVDTGSNGHFKVETEGTERFRIGPAGIATFNNDVKFPNDTKALFGSVTGLEIYHASSDNDSYIQKGTGGNLKIQTDQLFLKNRVGSEYMMVANGNGKVELYYDGVPKFQTTGAGITVTGISSASEGFNIGVHSAGTPVTTGSVKTLNFSGIGNVITYNASTKTVDIDSGSGGGGSGISSDRISEGNTSAEVVDTGTNGHFKVLTEGTERFRIGPAGIATFTADIATGSGNPGQINIDPTTSTSDGRIKYSGTKTFTIEGGSGFDNRIEIHGHQNSLNILCEGQGETELYFNGNKKLATTGAGITVTGISSASEGFDFKVNSSGNPVTTGSVKTLNFVGSGNTITYNASTKTVDIDINSGSGGGGGGGGTVFSGTFTASAGSPSTLNTYAYDSAELVFEYTVFVKNGSDYQSQKLLVMRDGTTVHSTQYGVMYSNNPLVELDATISGSNLLLRATPETGVNGSTTYRLKREVV